MTLKKNNITLRQAQCDTIVKIRMNKQQLEEKIIQTLKTCYDPEIPVDIFELGLIYEIAIGDKSNVKIKMTLTSPACPVAGSLPRRQGAWRRRYRQRDRSAACPRS